ncbi:MAG: UDP-N-acetylmuramoyl-L-alanyl-D-glutamate--2,6-diaminopimelate ligase [Clostridia bacterium]|nr:UDP-N-acetylmuramoyl-L-alanyl-D-glutamate--2,6-diaminopimelate ligase [Clostridia bacterium]
MKLSDLIKDLAVERKIGDTEAEISYLSCNSSDLQDGTLFFCIDGERFDSHTLAKEISYAGVVAFVCERPVRTDCPQIIVKNVRLAMALIASAFYNHPSEHMTMIAVTGTNGKTTTIHMLSSIFRAAGKKVGMIGTLGVSYDGKRFYHGLTTPDPIVLQSTLSDMKEAGVEIVVMEVSAHALYHRKVAGIRFAVGVFTNCTRDHLDFFGSMTRYMQTKERLFRQCSFGVLCFDDELGRKIAESIPHLSYALDNPAEVFAVDVEETLRGSKFVLNLSDELYEIRLSMTGRHNVSNALAAASCAHHLGVSLETIAKGLREMENVDGRLEYVCSFHGADIFVDFAHTPDGLEKSLNALNAHTKGRLICLFGCGGNRDKDKREIMGEIAGQICDLVILTSDNPRYEDPFDIIMDIERGVRRYSKDYVTVQERDKATEYAIKRLREGDILLLAGKGGEKTQERMGKTIPYDDKEKVLSLVASLKGT